MPTNGVTIKVIVWIIREWITRIAESIAISISLVSVSYTEAVVGAIERSATCIINTITIGIRCYRIIEVINIGSRAATAVAVDAITIGINVARIADVITIVVELIAAIVGPVCHSRAVVDMSADRVPVDVIVRVIRECIAGIAEAVIVGINLVGICNIRAFI